MEYNAEVVPEKIKYVAECLGARFTGKESSKEIGAMARDAFINFRDNTLGLKPAKSFPYDESKFEEAAKVIEADIFQNFQPRKVTAAEALGILKNIYK
jgi:alcohol dehydrogenase class IV